MLDATILNTSGLYYLLRLGEKSGILRGGERFGRPRALLMGLSFGIWLGVRGVWPWVLDAGTLLLLG